LIVAANKDWLTKLVAIAYMQENIQQAEVLTITSANHQGLMEQHRQVNAAAQKFVQELNRPTLPKTVTAP
jgi:hypothetical protein